MPEQLQFSFPSLDFPGRSVLKVDEVAEKLGCTARHVLNLIEEGKLRCLNAGAGSLRAYYRIPIEDYRDYVVSCMTVPIAKERQLRELPQAVRIQGVRDLLSTLPPAIQRELLREFSRGAHAA